MNDRVQEPPVSVASQENDVARTNWIAAGVYALDRWLRRRDAVFEYTNDPDCIFRIQRGRAEHDATLGDGTRVRRGDPVVMLHLWNEHMPVLAADGPSVGWAREVGRKIGGSLRELEAYMAARREFDEVEVLAADIALGTTESSGRIVRLAERYGFETVDNGGRTQHPLRRLGENVLMLLLVLASNPAAARLSVLRRRRRSTYLSRATLRRRAGRTGTGAYDVRRVAR